MDNIEMLYNKNSDVDDFKRIYKNLSCDEITKLINVLINGNAKEMQQDEDDIFLHLALYAYAIGTYLPKNFFDYILQEEFLNYPEIFMRANEEVSTDIIEMVEKQQDNRKIIKLVECIVAIPCEASKEFLAKCSSNPLPTWAEKLHTLPITWTTCYGWCVNQNNDIEKLYDDKVMVFQSIENGVPSKLVPLKQIDETCRYCGYPLTLVFDNNKKMGTCLYCSCYETIFVKQENSLVKWHEKNSSQESYKNHGKSSFRYKLKLTDEQRNPIASINEGYMQYESITQIGGMPTLTGGVVDYPKCPDCGKVMNFFAQYNGWEAEGIYYFFTCNDCDVHACNYLQT